MIANEPIVSTLRCSHHLSRGGFGSGPPRRGGRDAVGRASPSANRKFCKNESTDAGTIVSPPWPVSERSFSIRWRRCTRRGLAPSDRRDRTEPNKKAVGWIRGSICPMKRRCVGRQRRRPLRRRRGVATLRHEAAVALTDPVIGRAGRRSAAGQRRTSAGWTRLQQDRQQTGRHQRRRSPTAAATAASPYACRWKE